MSARLKNGSGSVPVSSSDSELGGAQVRLESGTLLLGWGSGPPLSAQIWKINLSGLGARLESEAHCMVWGSAPQSSAKRIIFIKVKEYEVWSSRNLMGRK